MPKNNDNNKVPPVHSIRIGAIRCAVWENETKNGVMFGTTLSRTYRDDDGEFHESQSLRRDDLLVAAKVLNEAHSWIVAAEKSAKQSDE